MKGKQEYDIIDLLNEKDCETEAVELTEEEKQFIPEEQQSLWKKHKPITYKLYWYLRENCYGVENAISNADLAMAMGINERMVRTIVNEIDSAYGIEEFSHIIASGNQGYWIATDEDEWITFNRLWTEVITRLKRLRIMGKKKSDDGQYKIKFGQYYQEIVDTFGE